MQIELKSSGFELNENNVWIKKGYCSIEYSDGDTVESQIARVILDSKDLSVGSEELAEYCRDWSTTYHLSGVRANILRPLESELSQKNILEIGSGCGAITRYLGECGANVLALEGTLRRASITRSRTRDLSNVTVLSENFENIDLQSKFDVITLIGVLEYANMYVGGDQPALKMVKKARNLLNQNGILIIAIENQNGLKYFAGAPEDHLGQPMYGLENRYKYNEPQTFGKVVIDNMLKEAGFLKSTYMAPFPDYKFPTSILTEEGILSDDFDAGSLVAHSVKRDPQLPTVASFSLERVWPSITANKLGLELSSSFLIVAHSISQEINKGVLCWHYSAARLKKFSKVTRFVRSVSSNQILVLRNFLYPHAHESELNCPLEINLVKKSSYQRGTLLSSSIIDIVTKDWWSFDEISEFYKIYITFISEFIAKEKNLKLEIEHNSVLTPDCIDILPSNIIIEDSGDSLFFDNEWVFNEKITMGFIVYRSLLQILSSISRIGRTSFDYDNTPFGFIKRVFSEIGWDLRDDEINGYLYQELRFQELATGVKNDYNVVLNWQKTHILNNQNLSIAFETNREQIRLLDEHVKLTLSQLSQAHNVVRQRDELINDLEDKIKETNSILSLKICELNNIYESKSWRCTSPFRWLVSKILCKRNDILVERNKKIIKKIWKSIPLDADLKYKFKLYLIRMHGLIFNKSKDNSDLLKSVFATNEPVEPNVCIYETQIPKIKFDDTVENFYSFVENEKIKPAVKVIAFYLPQFHPFEENDKWWGKGFTEWYNVGKAKPNYENHYQPHCPIHCGYYDLRIPQVMRDQAELAKQYGINGFNYYFYWFAGKILMEQPLNAMLNDKSVDMPFMLTWANENWTRRWDGAENDVLISQKHNIEDSLAFINHLIKYFEDDRYIRINNKPVLMIYRANIIPNMSETISVWRSYLKERGFDGIYLICAQTFGLKDPNRYGFDAAAEFPPHTVVSGDIKNNLNVTNPKFKGHIFSYKQVVSNAVAEKEPDYKLYRTAMLSWDNTARKQDMSHIFHGFSLGLYKQWIFNLLNRVYHSDKYKNDEKIVFVNAWNEWAEGTHLEPDRKYGYGYLQSTYDVLKNFSDCKNYKLCNFNDKVYENAIIIHAHYDDVVRSLAGYLEKISPLGFDIYVTSSSSTILNTVSEILPTANLLLVENRGRDILPFIKVLEHISLLGYKSVCKLHTKKSIYRNDGDIIRTDLYESLVGSPKQVEFILDRFKSDNKIGMQVPEKYLIEHTDHNMTYDHDVVRAASNVLNLHFTYNYFPAGSMFWFKPEALERLLMICEEYFELEEGFADGTGAHGIERIFANLVLDSGFSVLPI